MDEHDVRRFLGDISPRAAAVTLLLLDRVLDRYAELYGTPLSETDRRSIVEVLRLLARQDSHPAPPEPDQPAELEAELHRLDREIHRLRQRINWLRRGAAPSPETEAELAELERQYQLLGDRFVDLYRRWSR